MEFMKTFRIRSGLQNFHIRTPLHGARVPEWTPAGVCILGWSRSRSPNEYFRFEPEQRLESESRLRSVQEPIKKILEP